MDNKNKKFYIILVLSIMFANTAVIFTKNALSFGAMPIIIGFYRLGFSALIVVPFALYKEGKHFLTLTTKEKLFSMLAGIFMALHFLCYFSSLMYTNGFIATITSAVQPIVIAIASYFLFKETINNKSILGMIAAIIGILFIGIFTYLNSKGNNSFIGFIISMMTALFFCAYLLCSRGVLKRVKEYTFLAILFTTCAVILGLGAIITKTPFTGYPAMMYLNCFGLTFFCTILGHAIMNICVKYVSATVVSVVSLTGPLFCTFYDFLVFGEKVLPFQIIGGLIILSGVYLFIKSDKKDKEETIEIENLLN
ncbi:DMT family transporter [Anaerofustis stercorihominis]|uniref:Membrane protein n=1 Tax=Anaerofustis stercorihominis DSM 17244 TaxID=445971 RepID=B1CC47_9FIRM|nr:DMT family transporter [Anaerofustis stercorihominis]EDS71844.1 putative membrane protein [Anaerofustis stercorihominis DSM 17244]MCQ4796102.1 DMT family transporter [Anaerofustis stercorihominis]